MPSQLALELHAPQGSAAPAATAPFPPRLRRATQRLSIGTADALAAVWSALPEQAQRRRLLALAESGGLANLAEAYGDDAATSFFCALGEAIGLHREQAAAVLAKADAWLRGLTPDLHPALIRPLMSLLHPEHPSPEEGIAFAASPALVSATKSQVRELFSRWTCAGDEQRVLILSLLGGAADWEMARAVLQAYPAAIPSAVVNWAMLHGHDGRLIGALWQMTTSDRVAFLGRAIGRPELRISSVYQDVASTHPALSHAEGEQALLAQVYLPWRQLGGTDEDFVTVSLEVLAALPSSLDADPIPILRGALKSVLDDGRNDLLQLLRRMDTAALAPPVRRAFVLAVAHAPRPETELLLGALQRRPWFRTAEPKHQVAAARVVAALVNQLKLGLPFAVCVDQACEGRPVSDGDVLVLWAMRELMSPSGHFGLAVERFVARESATTLGTVDGDTAVVADALVTSTQADADARLVGIVVHELTHLYYAHKVAPEYRYFMAEYHAWYNEQLAQEQVPPTRGACYGRVKQLLTDAEPPYSRAGQALNNPAQAAAILRFVAQFGAGRPTRQNVAALTIPNPSEHGPKPDRWALPPVPLAGEDDRLSAVRRVLSAGGAP